MCIRDRTTRIRALWDQSLRNGVDGIAQRGFEVGVEYNQEEINLSLIHIFHLLLLLSFLFGTTKRRLFANNPKASFPSSSGLSLNVMAKT